MYPNKMSTGNTKPLQKVTNKKGKYKKMTADLKEKLRILFIQGVVDSKGFRDLPSIRDLANDHQVSENTLYKLAQRENWHEKKEIFQNEYEKELDQIRIKEFVKASKKFDSKSLEIAEMLLRRVGKTISEKAESSFEEFSPQHLDQLASASMKIQKFGKLALGETTDRIDIHATTDEKEIFQEAMELIEQVVRERQLDDNSSIH